MKTVAIVQARMGSSRFPGKMLSPLRGRPLIAWTVERVRRAKTCDEVVVATTDATADDEMAAWCGANEVAVFRGSEDDVLARFHECAEAFDATTVVRITGDCPLLDWRVIDAVAQPCVADSAIDYATNCEPMTYPEGISAEAMPMRILKLMHICATLPSHREHVTPYVRFAADRFHHVAIRAEPSLSDVRLTVDYPEDLLMIEQLVAELADRGILETADVFQVVGTLQRHPDIAKALGLQQRDLWRQEVARDEQRKAA
ncbi:MAG: hypothetical protein CMJ62_12780 [Planctomycetaceae bacterium]|nr:hypothetical protein [Planctomycetaceae bacterium]